jgi:hypothetical protein
LPPAEAAQSVGMPISDCQLSIGVEMAIFGFHGDDIAGSLPIGNRQLEIT